MSLHSICSLLLLLASRASRIECESSSEQIVAPSVVEDTAGALQLAKALYCGDSFAVEWLGFVILETPIVVYENSTLNVTGSEDGSSWVDGANQHQLFHVANGTLNLSGLNLIGGRTPYGGAILAFDSDVSVDSCFFVENNATLLGGAIYPYRSNVSVDNCSFVGNKATLYGGAIFAFESDVRLANCSFFENNASFGGAIGLSSSTLFLGNSDFVSNSAEYSGGDTSYGANSTGFYGGAIFAFDSEVSIDSSAFFENEAAWDGGAISCHQSSVSMDSCSFIGNEAIYSGGAIGMYESNAKVFNCLFTENIATFGGAVFLSSTNLVLGGANIISNSAEDAASNIYETNIVDFYGGAICAYHSVVDVSNCSFWENIATYGGAVFLTSTTVVLDDANFFSNAAGDSGGAIYGAFDTTIVVYGDAVWEANEAIYGGAIRLFYYSTLNILGSAWFIRNSAGQGGGIWMSASSNMTIFGSASFDENTAIIGGAMNLQEGTSSNFSGEVLMSGNTASSSGGAMYCQATESIVVYNTRFVSNFAGSSGGAISVASAGPENIPSEVSLCSFENNTAGDTGGAIHTSGGFIRIHSSNFIGNIAGRTGGAVLNSGAIIITRCVLKNNRAYTGPAVSNSVSVFISWTTFEDNDLLCEEGFFLDDSTNVSAYSTACHDCHAEEECTNCIVLNEDKVLVCEPILAHTASSLADGTLQSLELDKGFWRSSSTSKDVRECYEEEACLGGSYHYCAAGYTGPFCAVCMDGYARGLGFLCTKCSKKRRDAVIAVAAVIAVLFVVMVVVGIHSLASDNGGASSPTLRAWRKVRSRFRRARVHQSLKTLVVSWQIVTQFTAVASVTYPEAYEIFMGYIDVFNLNLSWMLSAGCLVQTNFFADLVVCTTGPLVIFFLVLVSYRVNKRRCPVGDEEACSRLHKSHGTILFWVSFLVYSTVSSTIFQAFACDELDTGKSYLRADHDLECYTAEHKIVMVYACIMSIVYPFGIPICYGLLLYRSRITLKKLVSRESAADVAAFKDLWRPYRPEVFWYEVAECLRRVILSGIIVFIFPNTAGQVATAFLFALAFFVVMLVVNPYMNQWDTWLAIFGHVIVSMSMFVAFLQKVDISEDETFSQDVFAGVLVATNCVMILAVGAETCGLYFLSVQEVGPPVKPSTNNHDVPQSSVAEGVMTFDFPEEKDQTSAFVQASQT